MTMSARSKVLAPIATVVAVVAVAGTAAVISQSGGGGKPSPLRLAAGSGMARDSAAAAGGAPMMSKMAGGSYTLTGTLPSGSPDDGRAYTLPRGFAGTSVVAKLADALGAPTPVRGKDSWTAGGLNVAASSGQNWYFAPCYGPDGAVSSGVSAVCAGVAIDSGPVSSSSSGGGSSSSGGSATSVAPPVAPLTALPPVTCQVPLPPDGSTPSPEALTKLQATCPTRVPPPGPGTVLCAPPAPTTVPPGTLSNAPVPCVDPSPVPEPPTPSATEVKAAAVPILSALGIDDSQAQVQTYPGGGSVTVDPKVDGLDTVGLETSISVDGAGKVTNANGWLSVPEAGDRYPLVSAQKAFDALPSFTREMLCPVGPDGQGCTTPEPQQITGAHLGLSVAYLADDVLALLPTWLFDVKGQDRPMPGVAVDPSYLQQASPEPGIIPPGEPGSADPAATRQVALTGWSPSKADNAVTVHYTTDGCGLKDVAADVKEDDKQVYVFLHGAAPDPTMACTEIAQAQTFEVALQGPLGDRSVVDGTNGTNVPKA